MCVTLQPATMGGTSVLTYSVIDDSPRATHITAYQNSASNLANTPNFMLLHFPGTDIELVDGPQRTRNFMRDVTRGLPELVPTAVTRGLYGSTARVERYGGAYTVILADHISEIPDLLREVPEHHRPELNTHLNGLLSWYEDHFPDYVFVLACFNGSVNPTYPIVVKYCPHSDDVLFAPGLEAHDGILPKIGQPIERDFRVAFGVQGTTLVSEVHYTDAVIPDWAPQTVSGFKYNTVGPNCDFTVPLMNLEDGLNGSELIEDLVV